MHRVARVVGEHVEVTWARGEIQIRVFQHRVRSDWQLMSPADGDEPSAAREVVRVRFVAWHKWVRLQRLRRLFRRLVP